MTNKKTNKQTVVEQPHAISKKAAPALSKQQQAAHDNANTHTKNDGSHIAQQRVARLAKHQAQAKPQENK